MKSLILLVCTLTTSAAFSMGIPAPDLPNVKFPPKKEEPKKQVKKTKQIKKVVVVASK